LLITTRRAAPGAGIAEQHALGHAFHLDHLRRQMPAHVVNQVQFRANHQDGGIPPTPEPASEVPINGGGLNGDLKWYPPGHPKHYAGG